MALLCPLRSDREELRLLEQATAQDLSVPVVVALPTPDYALQAEALRLGAAEVLLPRDLDGEALQRSLEHALIRQRRRDRGRELLYVQRDLGIAALRSRGLEETLRACLAAALQVAEMDCGGIYLVDPVSGCLSLGCHRGLSDRFVSGVKLVQPGELGHQRVMAGDLMFTYAGEHPGPYQDLCHAEGIRAIAMVPILREGQIIACLNVGSHVKERVPRYARSSLEAIASQIGVALARAREIEERELAQRRGAADNLFLETLLENSPSGVLVYQSDGACVMANPMAARIIGGTREQLLQQRFRQLPSWRTSGLLDDAEAVLAQGGIRQREAEVVSSFGVQVQLDCRMSRLEIGGEVLLLLLFNDIHALKQVEAELRSYQEHLEQMVARRSEALQESEEKYRHLFENAPVGLFRSTLPEGKLIEANERCMRVAGYDDMEEFLSQWRASEQYKDPAQRDLFLAQIAERGEVQGFEVELCRRDGSTVWVSFSARHYPEAGLLEGALVDVSELKRAQQAMAEQREQLFQFLEGVPAGVFILDARTEQPFYANEAAKQILGAGVAPGARPHELAQVYQAYLRGSDRLYPTEQMPVVRALRGEASAVDDMVVRRQGEEVALFVSGSPVYDRAGKVAYASVAFVDISARLEAEERIRRQHEQFLTILNNFPEILYSPAPATNEVVVVNQTVRQALGHDPAGGVCHVEFQGRDAPCPFCTNEIILRTREPHVWEHHNQALGRHYLITDQIIRWPDGRDVRFEVAIDITSRKRMEEELAVKNLVFEATIAGKSIADNAGVIHTVNPFFLQMWGYERKEQALGRPIPEFFVHPHEAEAVLAALDATGQWEGEFLALRADGSTFTCQGLATVVRDEQGQRIGYQSTTLDVTAQRQAEQQLKQALAELERSNRELEQFAYVASHDLQEPLRMVYSFMGLLQQKYRGQLDEQAQEYIHFAVDGAQHMRGLISDLLAFSRVGQRAREAAPVPLDRALDQALRNLGQVIEESGAVVIRGPLPTVLVDEGQLVQLLQNLLDNAIKFRSAAAPRVELSARQVQGMWELAVRDNGIGLQMAYAERIFSLFQRLHLREQYAGSGIGLSICKKVVELAGGRIWVQSSPGEGATFFFTLPGAEV